MPVKVGIAGLGGLGSNVAVMLVRSGFTDLVLADFDTVAESNLNRQAYFRKHIGMKKTDACAEILKMIDPDAEPKTRDVRLNEENISGVFGGCSIVCEALDGAEAKAMLVNTLLSEMPGTYVVSGSGISGWDLPEGIKTRHVFKRLFVCGDGISDTGDMHAPRVTVCAGHQANLILRLIYGMEDEKIE